MVESGGVVRLISGFLFTFKRLCLSGEEQHRSWKPIGWNFLIDENVSVEKLYKKRLLLKGK